MSIFDFFRPTPRPVREERGQGAVEPCETIFGNRGSGKTEGMKPDLLRIAKEGKCSVVGLDLPGTLGTDMVGQLCAAGMQTRTLFEPARATDRVLSWPFIEQLDFTDPLKEEENRVAVENFLLALWSKRGLKSGEEKPWTKKYAVAATRIFASQPVMPTLDKLDCLFQIGSPEQEELLQKAAARDSVRAFREVMVRSGRNPIQWEAETGASQRLMEIVKSPVIYRRHGNPGFDLWRKVLTEKMQVYYDLSGITVEAARALSIFVSNAVINTCRKLFQETGKAHPVVLVLEECGYLDLATPLFLDGMRAWRKAGFSAKTISQTVDDFKDEAVLETLLALTDRHSWYRLNSGIERAAQDLAFPTFDSLAVHYVKTRRQVVGHEEVKNKSKGKSKDEEGRTRTDEREGTSLRPIYEDVPEEVKKTPLIHEAEYRRKVSSLLVGERLLRTLAGVEEHTGKNKVTILRSPWPLSLTATKTRQAIEQIRSRSEYDPPPSSTPTALEMMDE